MSAFIFPWDTPPAADQPIEVAEGLWWVRIPLPMALDHVNCFVADDGDGWTVIDTGFDSRKTRRIWSDLFATQFNHKPISRVLITHHHPDHIGLAGWFMDQGAELWTTTTAYLTARMLVLDEQERPSQEAIAFWQRAGMDAEILAQRCSERPFNFCDCVHPLPLGHVAMREGQAITLASRQWDVRIGQGHAPDHITLWSQDGELVIAGDQILPGISPNVSVYPTEPEADPLGGWIESCARLRQWANDQQLILGGHRLPFRGAHTRLQDLENKHHTALERLETFISTPKSASQCFPILFKRPIGAGIYGLALGEAYAHLAHLRATGRAYRTLGPDKTYYFQSESGDCTA